MVGNDGRCCSLLITVVIVFLVLCVSVRVDCVHHSRAELGMCSFCLYPLDSSF